MNSIQNLIKFFPSYITKLYEKNLIWESSAHVMVLSIRPILNFKQPIVLNSEYNLEVAGMKEEKRDHDQNEVNQLRKAAKGKGKYGKVKNESDPSFNDKYILIQNYYAAIKNMQDEVDLCNLETESSLTIPDCVHKVSKIRKCKKIQNLNFDRIIEENNDLIKANFTLANNKTKYFDQHKNHLQEIIEEEINKREQKHEFIIRPPATIVKTSGTQTDPIIIDSDNKATMSIVNYMGTLRENAMLKRGLGKKASRIVSYLRNEVLQGMKDLARDWKKISDEVNPDEETRIATILSKTIDPQAKIALDQVIHPLILKSNKACQVLFHSGKRLMGLMENIEKTIVYKYYDLD